MRTVTLWIGIAAAFPLAAQIATFETGVTNIHVEATVIYQGKIVRNLMKDDLVVRDEGQARPILSFDDNTVPLDLVFLLDTGWGAMIGPNSDTRKNTSQVTAVASSALLQMRPSDRTAVISFAIEPHIEQQLTSDPKRVAAAIRRIPHNSWSIPNRFLALRWASWLLEADRQASSGPGRDAPAAERKRAVFIVTSQAVDLPFEEPDELLIERYWNSDVSINALVMKIDPSVLVPPGLGDLSHVAQATGGAAIFGTPKDSLEKQIPDLLARIQSSYTLFYSPPAAKSGEVRHITVELSDEAKKKYPGAVVHAREGYIAK